MNDLIPDWLRRRPRIAAAGALALSFLAGWLLAPPTPAPPARQPFPWSDPDEARADADIRYDGAPLFRRRPENPRPSAAELRAQRLAEREAEAQRSWRYGGLFRLENEDWRVVVLTPASEEPSYLKVGDLLPDGSRIDGVDARGVWVLAPDETRTRYGQPEQP